jgi:sugar/nucleoside kinase (ribokinase family)
MTETVPTSPNMIGIGAVFIDDIVRADGTTHMAQLGGGVVHALMGAGLWDERPGIVAVIGDGLPDSARALLEDNVDTRGLYPLDIPQMRAWQLFEHDGRRRELYRVEITEPFTTGAQPSHLPIEYQSAKACYLLQGFEDIRTWREHLNGLVLWEPLQQVMTPENANRAAFHAVLQDCAIDIVSPNLLEAQAIYGDTLSPDDLLTALLSDGARIAALRMGPSGSLIGRRDTGERCFIPAVDVPQIIDQTGAGNTYCGALLLGLMRGETLYRAGAMAAVAASFCLEQVGVVNPAAINTAERDQRYGRLLKFEGH